jgi:endonuclease/exonuclease/phosphatase family metal-dependent hydrolase
MKAKTMSYLLSLVLLLFVLPTGACTPTEEPLPPEIMAAETEREVSSPVVVEVEGDQVVVESDAKTVSAERIGDGPGTPGQAEEIIALPGQLDPGTFSKPDPPSQLHFVGKGPSSFTLKWLDNSGFELGNELLRQRNGAPPEKIEEWGPLSGWPVHLDSGLTPGRYCYYVTAWNDHGPSQSSKICAYTAGYLHKKLNVLTYNVYGKPDDHPEDDCSERAMHFGNEVANAEPAYDIVAVQEYYDNWDGGFLTCDSNHLREAIQSKGRYKNSNNHYLFRPGGWNVIDGGIGIFTLHPIEESAQWEWGSTPLLEGAVQGFILARIGIPFTEVQIDVYVVHLYAAGDGCDRACRRQELNELAHTVAKRSRESGNPVIITGDFNIGGPPSVCDGGAQCGNAGYEDIQAAFHYPRDVWLEAHPTEDGFTHDDCGVVFRGPYVPGPHGCNEPGGKRIDFILIPDSTYFVNTSYRLVIDDPDRVRVVSYRYTGSYPPFRRSSDHMAVAAELSVREKAWSVSDPCPAQKADVEAAFEVLQELDNAIDTASVGREIQYGFRHALSQVAAIRWLAYRSCLQSARAVPIEEFKLNQ